MKSYLKPIALIAPLFLAACGGAGGAMVQEPPEMIEENPIIIDPIKAPTATRQALLTTIDRHGAAMRQNRQPTPATGSAKFAGGMIGTYAKGASPEGYMFANIDAQANLFQGTFNGTARNFHLADRNYNPTERISGTVTFTGGSNAFSKAVTANGAGTLTGNFGEDTREAVDFSIDLEGYAVGPTWTDNMSIIRGSAEGNVLGGPLNGLDFDGDFYVDQKYADN